MKNHVIPEVHVLCHALPPCRGTADSYGYFIEAEVGQAYQERTSYEGGMIDAAQAFALEQGHTEPLPMKFYANPEPHLVCTIDGGHFTVYRYCGPHAVSRRYAVRSMLRPKEVA